MERLQEYRREIFSGVKEVPLRSQICILGLYDLAAWVSGFSLEPQVVLGRENIPRSPCLVIANHRGVIEPRILWGLYGLGKNWIHFMTKEETFFKKIYGPLCYTAGMISVRRGEGDKGAIDTAVNYLRNGHNVGVMPEGTRGGAALKKLMEFKNGAAYIALRANVPISPVAIIGSEEYMAKLSQTDQPKTNYLKERKKIMVTRPRPAIKVMIGPPIYGMSDYGTDDYRELSKICFEVISEQVRVLEKM